MKRHVPNAVGKPFSESTNGLKSAFTIAAFEWSDTMRLRSEAISRGKKQKTVRRRDDLHCDAQEENGMDLTFASI